MKPLPQPGRLVSAHHQYLRDWLFNGLTTDEALERSEEIDDVQIFAQKWGPLLIAQMIHDEVLAPGGDPLEALKKLIR